MGTTLPAALRSKVQTINLQLEPDSVIIGRHVCRQAMAVAWLGFAWCGWLRFASLGVAGLTAVMWHGRDLVAWTSSRLVAASWLDFARVGEEGTHVVLPSL